MASLVHENINKDTIFSPNHTVSVSNDTDAPALIQQYDLKRFTVGFPPDDLPLSQYLFYPGVK